MITPLERRVPEMRPHGGHCCGINHICNFFHKPYRDEVMQKAFFANEEMIVRAYIEEVTFDGECHCEEEGEKYDPDYCECNSLEGSLVLEIILTTDQMYEERMEYLTDLEFKEVTTWINPNSGNRCHLFLRNPQ